jgi:BON domain-containing protein
MNTKVHLRLAIVMLVIVLGITVGCTKAPSDAQVTSDIQSKLSADSGLQGKQLGVAVENGSVTLSGNVDTEAERDAAARYASSVTGVKQVVNNLTVAPATAAMTPAPAPVEEPKLKPMPAEKPRASKPRTHTATPPPPENNGPTDNSNMSMAAPVSAPVPSTPPPPQKVTVPSGTTLAVRLVDTIDSETATQGQTFHATLDAPLSVDGDVAVPSGYDVEGHVVEVASAGKFAGKSILKLQLDRISVGSKYYSIQTDQYSREGSSRGKNTATKVGAGAAIGAIIGGIAGGGKGAAIGAAAGGGLGGGVQAATKGQQIKLPSETVLNFTLQSSLTVTPTTHGPHEGRQKIESQN